MDILFKSRQVGKLCTEDKAAQKQLGRTCAKRLRVRLDNLRSAENLAVMRNLPGRCHELTGDLDELVALDLEHPKRLVLEVADDPAPRDGDGGLDWTRIRTMRVLRIEDYHG